MSDIVYNYQAKKLSKMLNNDVDFYQNIHLCVYKINTSSKYPFIQYMLTNNGYGVFTLPNMEHYPEITNNTVVAYSLVYISGLLLVQDHNQFKQQIVFDGFLEFNSQLYIFFDVTELGNDNSCDLETNTCFGLIDEITNTRKIYGMEIDPETSDFFINNNNLLYLYDNQYMPYEVPVVGYSGKPTIQKLNFTLTFGESAKNHNAILGPYFYFTSFQQSKNQFDLERGEYMFSSQNETVHLDIDNNSTNILKNKGTVRFALFTGLTKFVENMPTDTHDESSIKKQRLEDNSLNVNREKLTMRISDHDGVWSFLYDSVYLGKVELDDGSYLEHIQVLVLKNYEQQVPLSMHIFDK